MKKHLWIVLACVPFLLATSISCSDAMLNIPEIQARAVAYGDEIISEVKGKLFELIAENEGVFPAGWKAGYIPISVDGIDSCRVFNEGTNLYVPAFLEL